MKLKRGTIIQNVKIDRVGYGGVGIGKDPEGKVIMVKGALPESVVDIAVVKNKKDYIQGSIETVKSIPQEWLTGEVKCPHSVSAYHAVPDIPVHKQGCGGCKWQSVSYDKQLFLKEQTVQDALDNVLKNQSVDWYPVVPSPLIFQYRNKIEFSFGKYLVRAKKEEQRAKSEEEGDLSSGFVAPSSDFAIAQHRQAGFHKQGEFSKVVDVDQCFLVSEKVHAIYSRIKTDLKNSPLPVYDVKRHEGCLRHLVIREGVRTGQVMVNLALSDKWLQEHPKHQLLFDQLVASWERDLSDTVTTMVLTINNGLADTVHSKESHTNILRGEGVIYEGLQFEGHDLMKFQVSPFSFFQTNTLGAEELFSHAAKHLPMITGNVIDLYCGSGTIGLSFLRQGIGKRLRGIEIVESAVKDAGRNAKINGLSDRSEFHAGKAEKLLLEGAVGEEAFVGNDLVIIDPPRSGLHPKVVGFLRTMKQKYNFTLLYISCNPVTMARDIEGMIEGGVFSVRSMQPVDMFPHTHHVEMIGVMG